LIALAAVLWGLWPIFISSSGLTGRQAALITFAVMMLPAPFVFSRGALRDRRATLALIAVGVFDAGNAIFYFSALERGPVLIAVLTHYLAPVMVALASPLLLNERLSLRALLATPVILGALALVLGPTEAEGALLTATVGAASAVCYAGIVIYSKRAAVAWSPVAVTALHAPVALVVILIFMGSSALPAHADGGLAVMILGAAICGLTAVSIFNIGLRTVPAHLAGVLTYAEPVVGALVGVLWLGQPLGLTSALGAAVMLAAGIWVAREKR
jgi:drug/metabolite transporter (DMT)-like permease